MSWWSGPVVTTNGNASTTLTTGNNQLDAVKEVKEQVKIVEKKEETPSNSSTGNVSYTSSEQMGNIAAAGSSATATSKANNSQKTGADAYTGGADLAAAKQAVQQQSGQSSQSNEAKTKGPYFDSNYPQCEHGIVMNKTDGTIYCAINEIAARSYKNRTSYWSPTYIDEKHIDYINRYYAGKQLVVGKGTPYSTYKAPTTSTSGNTDTSTSGLGLSMQATDEGNKAAEALARADEMVGGITEEVASSGEVTEDVVGAVGYETEKDDPIRCRYGVIEYQGQQYCAYSEQEYNNYTKKQGIFMYGMSYPAVAPYFESRGEKFGALPAGRSDMPPPQPPKPPEDEPASGGPAEGLGLTMAATDGVSLTDAIATGLLDRLMESEALQFDKISRLQKSWDLLPAELKAAMAQRSEEVRRLRELRDLDPCAEINPDPLPDENPELEDEAPETGDPPTPPEPGGDEEFLEDIPFLVPKKTITTEIASADREVTVINRHLFDDDQYIPLGARARSSGFPDVTIPLETKRVLQSDSSTLDPLRYTSGKFWTFDSATNNLKFVNKTNDRVKIADGLSVAYGIAGAHHREIAEFYSPSDRAYTSTYNLIFPKNEYPGYFTKRRVAAYLLGSESPTFGWVQGSDRQIFREPLIPQNLPGLVDTVFSAEQPFFESELDNMRVSQFTSARIDVVVTTGDDPDANELQLPSLYSAYHKIKNVNKLLENMFEQQLNANTVEEANRIAQEIESIVSDPNQLYTKINCDATNRIYKFPCQQVIEMQEANNSSFRGYGNYVEISINTQQGSFISSILHETGMDLHVLEYLTSNNVVEMAYAESMSEAIVSALDPVSSQLSESGFSESSNIDNNIISRIQSDVNRVWSPSILERTTPNLETFFNNIGANPLSYYTNTLSSKAEQYPLSYDHSDNPGVRKFIDGIKSVFFTNKLYNFLGQDHIRSYSDILEGKKCYSEIIGYRVSKHIMVGNNIIEEPIQQFYFMDSDQIRDFKFIDTQVRSGTKYIYRVRSINFVIGSVSVTGLVNRPDSESSIISEGPTSFLVAMKTVTTPTLRIIEAPFFERIVSVVPKPPMSPQASFLPYQGIDDKLQILIQTSFGEVRQKPISILPEDLPALERMITSQAPDSEGKIMYKNDSMPLQFQIFRMSTPPTSYADFAGADYKREVVPNSTSFLYLEEGIEPNRDYYYMFREYDGDGISNPSQVYRVRMVSYPNGIYMDLDVYDMQANQEEKMKISFGSSIQISPSAKQSELDFSSTSIDSREFALSAPDRTQIRNSTGNSGDAPVWGRKFKARIISKTSGKKIDINFRFEKKSTVYEKAEQSQAEQAIQNPPVCE